MWSRMKMSRHGQRGMSIVELLVVVMIMTVVMVAVMGLYLPAQRSTVVQTQLSDIQSDLRLALKTMTNDLLSAGFLIPTNSAILMTSDKDFTISTRIIGDGFARVGTMTNSATLATVPIARADMADNFPDNSLIRLFSGTGKEINADSVSEADRVYTVVSTVKDTVNDKATFQITDPNTNLSVGNIGTNTIVVKVLDDTLPAIQTIRYVLSGDALERRINESHASGRTQILARNLDLPNSLFTFQSPNLFTIKLTGKTSEVKTAEGSIEKSRGIETSVKLRNVRSSNLL